MKSFLSSLLVVFLIAFFTTTIHADPTPSNPTLTITPFLPTDGGFYVHILIPIQCQADDAVAPATTSCTQISSFTYKTTPISTSNNYLFSNIFSSIRFPDGNVHFLSSNKGTPFAKDKLNAIELINPATPIPFSTPFKTATLQVTFSITAPSLAHVNRFKTGLFQIAFDLDNGTKYNLNPEFSYTPAASADIAIYNNTVAVKNPITTESFQFIVDTAIDHTPTDLYTSLVSTTPTPTLPTYSIPPISTTFSLISPTEFSFVFIPSISTTFQYPATVQQANCFLNSFPVNATISANAAILTFSPVLSNIIGLIARNRPVIQCRDIHLRNLQAVGDNVQFKYTSLLFTSYSEEKSLITEIVDGTISTSVRTTLNSTMTAFPIQFYAGVLPQLVLGTTIYQAYDLSKPATTGATTSTGVPDSTTGNSDHYMWDIEYPFPNSDILDQDAFHLLRDHSFISPAFLSFPTTTAQGINYASTARNIIKIRNPYNTILDSPTVPSPHDYPSLWTSPTLNITANPGMLTSLSPFIHLWHSDLNKYYASHFSFSFSNLIDKKINRDSSIQSLTLSLPLTPLTTNISKLVQITYRTTPSHFSISQVPAQTFSPIDAEIDFTIATDWFSSTASYRVARVVSLGNSYFKGDFRSCTAVSSVEHSPLTISVAVPQEHYEFIDIDTDFKIQQNDGVNIDFPFFPQNQFQPQDTSNIQHAYAFYIYFDRAVFGDVRIHCSFAKRSLNTPITGVPPNTSVIQSPVSSTTDIIMVGTDHYGPIFDKVLMSTANVKAQMWTPLSIAGTDIPTPPPNTSEKGLSTGIIVLIVFCSIIGEILLMIACYFGIRYYALPWYRNYKQEQAQYKQQQDQVNPDIVGIVKQQNGMKTKKKGKKGGYADVV